MKWYTTIKLPQIKRVPRNNPTTIMTQSLEMPFSRSSTKFSILASFSMSKYILYMAITVTYSSSTPYLSKDTEEEGGAYGCL
ncbi:hypothetical protein AQUCO_08000012v1 [Aquilegia coerulea]|uniref:Uncharacterized protein n=1 Tax=Aquilegia coerulea TaxID=218851 RepID=A0A2G5C7V1_AQUCA|nr:hypothetical protein AQUCO_08000012v1 [Aquilegia coerulea]